MEHNVPRYILGVRIDDISLGEAVERCASFLRSGRQAAVVTPNAEICAYGYRRKWYRRLLESANLSLPDGFGLKVGGFLLGQKIVHRFPGVDLTQRLLDLAEHKNYSVLFLGGSDQIGERLLMNLKRTHPNLGVRHLSGGTFDDDGNSSDTEVLKKINAISPHILFVCLGHPKQESFMLRNRHRISAGLLLGVGGTIDYLAGSVSRAPKFLRAMGLEWFYRLLVQPRRIRRILEAVIVFPAYCIAWRWRRKFVYRNNVAALILNDKDEVLVCKHAIHKFWHVPQGGVEPGEPLEEAVLREMREELGTDKFKITASATNVYHYDWPRNSRNFHKYKNRGQMQSVFVMRFTGSNDDIKLNIREISDFTWIQKDAILQSPIIPEYKKAIIKIGLDLLAKNSV